MTRTTTLFEPPRLLRLLSMRLRMQQPPLAVLLHPTQMQSVCVSCNQRSLCDHHPHLRHHHRRRQRCNSRQIISNSPLPRPVKGCSTHKHSSCNTERMENLYSFFLRGIICKIQTTASSLSSSSSISSSSFKIFKLTYVLQQQQPSVCLS